MKLGLFTACLPTWNLERIAETAAACGFDALELAAWPTTVGRSFQATHVPVTSMTEEEVAGIRAVLDRWQLEVSSLGYYGNNLHPDPETRAAVGTHLRLVIDAAEKLGVGLVGTFIGRDWHLSVPENRVLAEKVMPPLVEYAAERNVQLMIENCPMEGWHPDGYPANIAYSPELWRWMIDTLGLRLNWDPSHLLWMGIDPVETIAEFAPAIVHTQAKDVQIFPRQRNRYGVFGTTQKEGNPWRTGWWRYRVPGRGEVDWSGVVDALYDHGYTGAVSVEHEDPVWGGDPERVWDGLRIAYHTLRPLVPAEAGRGGDTLLSTKKGQE